MDKILLGISGSPRKRANCELFIREIHRCLGTGWQLQLIHMPDQEIAPCEACYRCLFEDMHCPREDDFLSVLDAIASADAYVVAAPAYLLSANSSIKKFIDRGLQFYAYLDRLWHKPAVGVAIAGIEGKEGSTKLGVESFIKLTFADMRGSAVVYGALPGEVLLSEKNKRTAASLAAALLDPGKRIEPETPVCPLCGGDTFRLLPEGGVRCMLCSESGSYSWEDGRLRFHITSGDHPLFFTKEAVRKHADWLRDMKNQYLERRQELKKVWREYFLPKS
ncbi:MAG: flavodoxin family protein [Desulfobacteraceae bacterium]|nr:flavodoxin family protein [Desulfobacteraceae bacterium]